MSTEADKVYSGEQIKGLFSKPLSFDVTIEHETYGKIKFVCKPMNNNVYAQMGEAMKASGIDIENANNLEALKVFGSVYYPAMKIVFPFCCLDPKITAGTSTDNKTLELANVPMDVCMDLFNQILSGSGMGDKAEKTRKNL